MLFEAWKKTVQNDPKYTEELQKIQKSNVQFDGIDFMAAKNLYLVQNFTDLFQKGFSISSQAPEVGLPNQLDDRSRRLKISPLQSSPSLGLQPSDQYFNGFSNLPLSLTLLDTDFSVQPDSTGKVPFFVKPEKLTEFLGKNRAGSIVKERMGHVLIINSRSTEFSLFPNLPSLNSNSLAPLQFQYFEDGINFERCYVQPDFLGAALYKELYQYVQMLHSSSIVYTSLKFTSYEQKIWSSTGLKTRKSPLKEFESVEVPFLPNTIGRHSSDYVNYKANLLFTAQFLQDTENFFKTNRVLTCSAFETQASVADANYSSVFDSIEKALINPVCLSTEPVVQLIPAFERGNTIEVGDSVFFRGLASNASSLQLP